MSARAGHPALSSAARRWLAALSDPGTARPVPARPFATEDAPRLAEAAWVHGVAPIVARNARTHLHHRSGIAPSAAAVCTRPLAALAAALEERLVPLAAQGLLLAHHATRIARACAQQAIAAQVVKGPVFARRLYPQPADRSFTDIDVLVAPASLAAGFALLRELGFAPVTPADAEPHGSGEYKWVLPGREFVMVELQTDLIHSANLGGGIRLRHDDLIAAGDGDADDATALLLVAAVHGAAGHQFERLQTCVDVLQAARGVAGAIDRRRLVAAGLATGATAALQSALDLAAMMFDEPMALELADSMPQAAWRRLRRQLVTPPVVLRAQARGGGLDSWRRRALRDMIRRSGRTTICATVAAQGSNLLC